MFQTHPFSTPWKHSVVCVFPISIYVYKSDWILFLRADGNELLLLYCVNYIPFTVEILGYSNDIDFSSLVKTFVTKNFTWFPRYSMKVYMLWTTHVFSSSTLTDLRRLFILWFALLRLCPLHLNKEKSFLFHLESSFRSWDNHVLNLQIFKFHDVTKCLSMKHETHFIE